MELAGKVQEILSLTKEANNGNPIAQYKLALRYQKGRGVARNLAQAETLFKQVAEYYEKQAKENPGDAEIKYIRGVLYEEGHGVTKNLETALVLYKQAAWEGSAKAYYVLGHCFETGRLGVKKNCDEATTFYEIAANQGHAKAQFKFAYCLQHGNGIAKKLPKAVEYYNKAIGQMKATDLMYIEAKFNLALCHQELEIQQNKGSFNLTSWLGFKKKKQSVQAVGYTLRALSVAEEPTEKSEKNSRSSTR